MAKTTTDKTDEANTAGTGIDGIAGKGRPTPTRKQKEAERKRPLVSNDRAEARRQSRVATQIARDRQRIGMANGEEKYLPVRDRGPQKRFVRDYVDARFSVGEVLIPLMLVIIVVSFFNEAASVVLIGIWAFFGLAVIDCVILGFTLRRKLTAKFGHADSGVRWYAAMRALQLRVMRLPKPQVKRGAFPS